jgi:hypothetical protein
LGGGGISGGLEHSHIGSGRGLGRRFRHHDGYAGDSCWPPYNLHPRLDDYCF